MAEKKDKPAWLQALENALWEHELNPVIEGAKVADQALEAVCQWVQSGEHQARMSYETAEAIQTTAEAISEYAQEAMDSDDE